MIKNLFIFAALFAAAPVAAQPMAVIETVGHRVDTGSGTVSGVACSTGTAIQIDNRGAYGLLRDFNRAWVRVQNQSAVAGCNAYVGFNSNISTMSVTTLNTRLGERLSGGDNAPYPIGRGISLYCKAADACGATGAPMSVLQVGWK